jgi:hypothetical protein
MANNGCEKTWPEEARARIPARRALRLRTEGLSWRAIAKALGAGDLYYLSQRPHRLRQPRSTVLIVRVTVLLIGLHILEILLWAAFCRLKCFRSWGFGFTSES